MMTRLVLFVLSAVAVLFAGMALLVYLTAAPYPDADDCRAIPQKVDCR